MHLQARRPACTFASTPRLPIGRSALRAPRARPSVMAAAGSGPVYVVVVTGKVKPGQMGKFKELFKPLADHVHQNEDGCLSYQLSVDAEDPDALLIFERYVSKEYLENVHWQSAPFKEFGAKTHEADVWVSKEVKKYWEEAPGAWGFMGRS